MRIPCPYCGERGNEEFIYRGDATVTRPDGPSMEATDAASESRWMDYVYLRRNPAGPHREFWYHATGCHAWLVVTRDVRDHAILEVQPAMPLVNGR
jgi:heterotetrameric sarcosine oxidase delta subunit